MTSRFRIGVIVFSLALQVACSSYRAGDSESIGVEVSKIDSVKCGKSVLDAASAPIVTVGEILLYLEDDGYYKVGRLASAQVLESYPEKLHIVTRGSDGAQAISVSMLLPSCQAKERLLNAELQMSKGEWVAAVFDDFHESSMSVIMLESYRKIVVDFQSVRFSLQGDSSEDN